MSGAKLTVRWTPSGDVLVPAPTLRAVCTIDERPLPLPPELPQPAVYPPEHARPVAPTTGSVDYGAAGAGCVLASHSGTVRAEGSSRESAS